MPCILINDDNGHDGNDFRGGGVGLGVELMNLKVMSKIIQMAKQM